MSKIILRMSQTEEDTPKSVNSQEENIPKKNHKVIASYKVINTRSKDIKSKLIQKKNREFNKRRKERILSKIRSQVLQEKKEKDTQIRHESKKCCLLSPKRTYQAIYNEISYPKTSILPDNEKEWENLKCVEDMYDEYGLTNYITKLHKQLTSIYFMVRDLEYSYCGYHL